ncbi:hypothetical protein LUZ61_017913 [Rhynchospora tenuis]|uniref:Protein FAR1-RELATED SEQUENCE n=1 Tax=Rhynchospora tenuis TaxID=198213 RepID=A0AAD5Z8A7_9POAL|nr:hypothetical protein LUZ61_017913 [Rhynchospora tenuis]
MGFSIRRGSNYISAKKDVVTGVRFVCSKEGFSKKYKEAQRSMESFSNERTPEKEKGETRTGCKASLRILLVNGVWKVSVFKPEHNHPLITTPSKKRNLRSHKCLSYDDREVINAMRAQNIETTKIHEYLGTRHGGKSYLSFKRKDVSNEVAIQNRSLIGVDVESTLVYFQKKKEEDSEFFYAVEIDENGRLKNFFWVDGRARRAFQEFGDVVTFDTTYQTNRYSMPLAPFLGVNHHRMSIFFGFAMLRSEDKDGFIWLFQTWKKAMYGKEPIAIITDQDPAMKLAIKDVFPNTVHRCCQWHVMRKARDHLGILYSTKLGFEEELKRVINRSRTVADFERGWATMLQSHKLSNNRHLKVMYAKRAEWVPSYFRDFFFADMSTTQRSESANAKLKIWTNNHTSMYQLVLHVEKMVEGIWQNESDEI